MYICRATKKLCLEFEDFLAKAREKLEKVKEGYGEKSEISSFINRARKAQVASEGFPLLTAF